jgi:hypothetical protein
MPQQNSAPVCVAIEVCCKIHHLHQPLIWITLLLNIVPTKASLGKAIRQTPFSVSKQVRSNSLSSPNREKEANRCQFERWRSLWRGFLGRGTFANVKVNDTYSNYLLPDSSCRRVLSASRFGIMQFWVVQAVPLSKSTKDLDACVPWMPANRRGTGRLD